VVSISRPYRSRDRDCRAGDNDRRTADHFKAESDW
jgi:hypothetical protein